MKAFRNFIKEDKSKKHLDDFLSHVSSELGLQNLPKITLINDKKYSVENRSFGGYSPGAKSITVNTADRHVVDVYRTLAHELVHYKQDIQGRLTPDNVAEAGATGSEFENEANTLAGIIMRNYGRRNPKLFESYHIGS